MTDLFQADPLEPQVDPNKNYLEELVGPGKKFATPEDLAKGKYYADEMIKIKNQREDEMREYVLKLQSENAAKAKLEDLIDRYKERLTNSETPPAKEDDTPKLDMTKIENFFDEKFQKVETARRQEQNFNLVESKLKERFGPNYANALKQETEALGLSKDFVNQMARTQPEAFLRLVGADRKPPEEGFQPPVRSNQRNESFAPTAPKARTWSYYQELKKSNPNLYFDRQTATQMAKDAVELGDAFTDGNFYVSGLHDK